MTVEETIETTMTIETIETTMTIETIDSIHTEVNTTTDNESEIKIDANTQATTDAFLALKAKMEALDAEVEILEEKRQKLIWKNLAGAITPKEFETQLALIDDEESKIDDLREGHLEQLRLIMTDNT